ncbi:MAG: PQQ-binding-like beta-propeller repeat protein [Acidobacteriota bacterium]|nr:PQQ-binding-like beta-propeller repeat protein [Acidobacteriota bacterium]
MTSKKCISILVFILTIAVCATAALADWPTFGHDPQRSGYSPGEDAITVKNASSLQLLWKTTVKNGARSLTALTAPVVATGVNTAQGLRSVVYVAGSSDEIYALDGATGKVIWSRDFPSHVLPKDAGMWLCPNNLNATPVIDESRGLLYVISADGDLFGLDLSTGRTKFGPVQFVPPFAKDWSLNLHDGVVYTSISQGCGGAPSGIYSMNVRHPAMPVVRDLLVEPGKGGGGIWGRGGPVIGKNGKIYAAMGDGPFNAATGNYGSSYLAASLGSLRIVDYYSPLNYRSLTSYDLDLGSASPVWFSYRNFNLLAAGAKEGVLYLLNADKLGDKDHRTPLYAQKLANDNLEFEGNGIWGSPSAWMDTDGVAWVYVPILGPVSKSAPSFPLTNGPHPHGSVMAFNVVMNPESHQPTLRPVWISGDFDIPEPVAIADGVVFALSTGENTQQTFGSGVIAPHLKLLTDKQRGLNTHIAVLYALDAKTGKVLYQSGDTISTWTHFSGLAIEDGKVYVVDHGSTVYCFGLKADH